MNPGEYRTLAKRDIPGELIFQLRACKLPEPMREVVFAKAIGRLWRFDLAWPERKIAVECDGGTWTAGRHVRGKGFAEDCVKFNTAAENGWRVFRFTTEMVDSGEAATTIERVLNDNRAV